MAAQQYTPQTLSEMSRRLADIMNERGIETTPLDPGTISAMMDRDGEISRQAMPRQINQLTLRVN